MSSLAQQLGAYLSEMHAPFDWSGHTCAHWVGAWVHRATGRDPLSSLPACAGVRDWLRVVAAAGGLQPLISRQLRCGPVPPAMAQLGDVVLMPGEQTGGILALCAGTTAAMLGDDGASVHAPMSQALAAWRLREVAA